MGCLLSPPLCDHTGDGDGCVGWYACQHVSGSKPAFWYFIVKKYLELKEKMGNNFQIQALIQRLENKKPIDIVFMVF